MRLIILLLAFFLLPGAPLAAATARTPLSLTTSTPAAAALNPAAATRAWLETVPADKRARSDAYFEGGYWLLLWNFLLGAAISIFLLASGFSARLRALAEKATRFQSLQVALYAAFYVTIVF